MTGGSTDLASAPEPTPTPASRRIPLQRQQIVFGAMVAIVIIVVIALAVHYHSGRARRQYDALMLGTLDRLLTAQEGFFYDSSHYVGSLHALPTVHVPAGVHVELVNPDRRSWWGIATHGALRAHRCVVWVGKAPASFPVDVRAPENEAKPMCFDDDAGPGANSSTRS